MLPIRAETTVSTYGSVEIARLKKKKERKKEEDEQLAVLTNSSLVLPRWLLVTLKVFVVTEHSRMKVLCYSCCFSRVFQASVCIATYGMSVPSLHTESTDSVIGIQSVPTQNQGIFNACCIQLNWPTLTPTNHPPFVVFKLGDTQAFIPSISLIVFSKANSGPLNCFFLKLTQGPKELM